MDLVGINVSNFAITCSIYSKCVINLILAGIYNFSENGAIC